MSLRDQDVQVGGQSSGGDRQILADVGGALEQHARVGVSPSIAGTRSRAQANATGYASADRRCSALQVPRRPGAERASRGPAACTRLRPGGPAGAAGAPGGPPAPTRARLQRLRLGAAHAGLQPLQLLEAASSRVIRRSRSAMAGYPGSCVLPGAATVAMPVLPDEHFDVASSRSL